MLVYEPDYIRHMCTLFGADAFKMMRRKPEGIPYVPSEDELMDAMALQVTIPASYAKAKEAKAWLTSHLPTNAMHEKVLINNAPSIVGLLSRNKRRCTEDAYFREKFADGLMYGAALANFDKVARAMYAEGGKGLFSLARYMEVAPARLDRAMQEYCWEIASPEFHATAKQELGDRIGDPQAEIFADICDALISGRTLDMLMIEQNIEYIELSTAPEPPMITGRLRQLGRQAAMVSGIAGGLLFGKAAVQEAPGLIQDGYAKVQQLRYEEEYKRRHGTREDQGEGMASEPDTTQSVDLSPRILYEPRSKAWAKDIRAADAPKDARLR